jgi:hypothetical protein
MLGATASPSTTGSAVRPQPPCSVGTATLRNADRPTLAGDGETAAAEAVSVTAASLFPR